jgi:plastocyanin
MGRRLQRILPVVLVLAGATLIAGELTRSTASDGERTVTLRYGPISLHGYEVESRTAWPETPRLDGHITKMSARVVDARGAEIPLSTVMLHHVLFANEGGPGPGDRRDGACPSIPRERFFGRGEEGRFLELPDGYGYPVSSGDRWRMGWMLMNHTRERRTAYIEYTMTVDTERDLEPVKPFWLDAAQCRGGSIFSVPGDGVPGSTYDKTVDWVVPFDGRIVEAGAHLHGGAFGMSLRQPACENRDLLRSRALYGEPDDPVYRVLPVLHEPGPIATSTFRSATGLPVRGGDLLRGVAEYDGERPHPAVMAMLHVYVARDDGPPRAGTPVACDPPPDDATNTLPAVLGRTQPPDWRVPLTGLDGKGRARTISAPPGRIVRTAGDATVDVTGWRFDAPRLSVPAGATVRWRFGDPVLHNVTVADGPAGFASFNLREGRSFAQRLTRRGTYRLFCSLHPVEMQQVVTVR